MKLFLLAIATLTMSFSLLAQPVSFDSTPCNDLRGLCEARLQSVVKTQLANYEQGTEAGCGIFRTKLSLGKVIVQANCSQPGQSNYVLTFSASCNRCTGDIGKIKVK